MMKKIIKLLIGVTAIIAVTFVYADEAPVVDLTSSNATTTSNATYDNTQDDNNVQENESEDDSNSASQASTPIAPPVQTQSLSMSDRVSRLEQQMTNIVNMNLPQQINDIQQALQQVQGQLQVQAHDLKLLNEQERSFYQDIDQRINQLKNLGSAPSATMPSASSNSGASPLKTQSSNDSTQLNDANAYRDAFNLVSKKQYVASIQSLNNYLNNFPNGAYVANAHYWLGEVYALQKKNDQAVAEFNTVILQYPKSSKVADAKLKLAIIHARMGDTAKALEGFKAIKREYPGSTAAQLASLQLQQMSLQGNASNTNANPSTTQ